MKIYFSLFYCITSPMYKTTRTLFISSQHPDFDVCLSQLLYGLWHTVLQLVLHGCRSQQLRTTQYSDFSVSFGDKYFSTVCFKQQLWSHSGILSSNMSRFSRWTNQQVFLYLFIKFIKSLLSLLHGSAGLVVALLPVIHEALIQVLVGQNQRAKAIACVLLESLVQLQTQVLTSFGRTSGVVAVHQ